ncbi:MAG: peptidoglycan editing factor PgeF [Azovibrio sp.]|nr:peptidoglycan editing factor PgeF [Azovibrio sp.]
MSLALPELILPDWPAPAQVRALQTTRRGGVSQPPYASFNLGGHVGDRPEAVAANRACLEHYLPAAPTWLEQVHGTHVLALPATGAGPWLADAAFTRQAGVVCAVLSADCLPVLLCDRRGTAVAAAHAGWRGLLAGVLEATVAALGVPGAELMAWLGPAIGEEAFEVGEEVRAAFVRRDAAAAAHFRMASGGKYRADLCGLARQRLAACGITAIHGGQWCTWRDAERFFSYRRDGVTGRMASLIWLDRV